MKGGCLVIALLIASNLFAGDIKFKGQASGWITLTEYPQTGLRYMPELRISQSFNKNNLIDAEFSINAFSYAIFDSIADFDDSIKCKLYRASLRYSMTQSEIRIGLQKINFGPAKILRSLMWFDRLDARDPLELTEGVYAGLLRYYFLNNTNVWVWGLLKNDNTKGIELIKTDKDVPEFGGRCQFPVLKGEGALTFNHRKVDTLDWFTKMGFPIENGVENRFAVDGDWDIGPGVWFESSAGETKINENNSLWQKFTTIGTDYTIGIGPGIHILCEHFIGVSGKKITESSENRNLSAVEVDFNLGILDRVNIIGYYDWMDKKFYSYLGFQRTYDNWSINALFFSSKKDVTQALSGNGMQFLIAYNH